MKPPHFSRAAGWFAITFAASLAVAARGQVAERDDPFSASSDPFKLNTETPTAPATFPDLKKDAAGYWQVGFEHLASFPFGRHKFNADEGLEIFGRKKLRLLRPEENDVVELPTEPGTSGTIPESVKSLDGKRVRISGYMLPVKVEDGVVKECLLLRNQNMCCFGRRPELNEWVVVKMKGKGVPSTMDTPVTFFGTLHVGEMFENGVFEGLYELDGEKVINP